MRQFSVRYNLLFSAAICGVAAVIVSSLAVGLKERQDVNALLFKQSNVLEAAGLSEAGEKLEAAEIEKRFATIDIAVIDLETGELAPDVDATAFDQQKAKKDSERSREAPDNRAGIKRVPLQAQVFTLRNDGGQVEKVILPIEGYGLWSTLYGFVALSADTKTIEGLTYYEHGETAGLGGEVDNPRWKSLWPGRQAFDPQWQPKIEVIKGAAGPAADNPYEVDGLSGATITSRGVTNMLHFWLGPEGFGPYLEKLRAGGTA